MNLRLVSCKNGFASEMISKSPVSMVSILRAESSLRLKDG